MYSVVRLRCLLSGLEEGRREEENGGAQEGTFFGARGAKGSILGAPIGCNLDRLFSELYMQLHVIPTFMLCCLRSYQLYRLIVFMGTHKGKDSHS